MRERERQGGLGAKSRLRLCVLMRCSHQLCLECATVQVSAVDALVSATTAAQKARAKEEMEARRREAAEKAAKAKAEKEAMKAAMARDRAEVAARGPAQASIAKKLPTESGGTMTSARALEANHRGPA